ncbi:MAG: hypothetical protein HY255_00215 [Betaproteobacteria bacterium]|nr:hypothetical protein [Betaproteobacteria bacterium]
MAHKPDILIGANSGFALRLRDCNFGLPLLFFSVDDPLAEKMVDSLAAPRLGMTGYTLGPSTEFKRHEFLLRLAPGIRVIGKLQNEAGQEEGLANPFAAKSNLLVQPFHVVTPTDLEMVLELPEARRVDAWDVPYTKITFAYAAQSVPMLARLKKPVIHARLHLLKLGAMAAYEPDASDSHDVLAEQARLVLDGVPIDQISVVQSSRFRLGLNLPACHAAGIKPSKRLLLLADQVLT